MNGIRKICLISSSVTVTIQVSLCGVSVMGVLEQWSDAAADTLSLEQANLILNAGHDASTLAHSDELSVNSLLTQHLAKIVKEYDPWGSSPCYCWL